MEMKSYPNTLRPGAQTVAAESLSRTGMWMLIAGILLIAATLRAPITAVGPLIEIIRVDTGISNTLMGMLTAFPLLAFALLSPLAPRLARRLGIEYTLLFGLIALTVGIGLRFLPSVPALYIGTALLGMGIALSNVLLPGLIKKEFPNQPGLMTGVYSMSMNMWAAIASGISLPLANGLGLGWRGSLAVWGVLSAAAFLVWLPQLRNRHRPSVSRPTSQGNLWQSSIAWNVTLFMGLQSITFYIVMTWLPEILAQQGMNPTAAGWMLSLMQFVSLPASFLVPIVAGRFRDQRGMVAIIALFLIAGYLMLLSGMHSLMTMGVVLIGIAGGSAFSLATMFFILRTSSASQAAELSGMAQTIGYLLAAGGPVVIGYVYDATHNWTVPLLILLALALCLLVFGLGAAKNRQVSSAG
jgi:CP family cyanate transporter-like MFS transporter